MYWHERAISRRTGADGPIHGSRLSGHFEFAFELGAQVLRRIRAQDIGALPYRRGARDIITNGGAGKCE